MSHAFFRHLSAEVRGEQRRAYRAYLAARDGEPDLSRRTLARREEAMARFRVPSRDAVGRADPALFEAQYRAFDARRATPRELLLLLAFVKINGAEAYGVGRVFEDALARAAKDGDDLELLVLLEEHY